MKRILIFLFVSVIALEGFGQSTAKYTENDVKQFYRTLQGDYQGKLNDSTMLTLHITPIWEREDDLFHWLYLEAVNKSTKEVLEQKILEVVPISDIAFKVVAYSIDQPARFEGKWSNRNFFDGFNTKILKKKGNFQYMKTKDFEYQTGWNRRKNLKCFPSGDWIHFKLVQEEERLYVKRVPKQTSHIIGITFTKDPID